MVGFGVLEWSFLGALVLLVGAVTAFLLFLLAQLFRIHSRR
ncbi:MAG TPA: hypothetical protein VF972_04750 [Actinomycetota bacterium]